MADGFAIKSGPVMRARKQHAPSDWRFTMQQIGRELRKVDPPRDMSPRLRALLMDLERKWAIAMQRNQQHEAESGRK